MKRYSTGLETKKRIIKALKEKPISLRKLETKLNIGYKPIKLHCNELKFLGIINIIKHKRNDRNGRPYKVARLTSQGMKIKV